MDPSKKAPRGFTFIEIVVSISILVLIMGVAYGTLTGIIRGKKALDDYRDSRAITDSILQRLTRELQLAYEGIPLLPPEDNLENLNSARLNMIGSISKEGGVEFSSITFLALEGGQYLPDGGSHSGIVQITYRVSEDPEYKGEPKRFMLIREEVPYLRPFSRAYEKKMVFPVTKSLSGLEFRYYNRQTEEWHFEWGTRQLLRLPGMVGFTIKILSPLGRVETLTSAVAIRSSGE